MPNPFAGRPSPRRPRTSEVASPLDHFLRRLTLLGATEEEVVAVAEHWHDFDDDWTPARRRQVIGLSDAALVQLLREGRAEYAEGTTSEDEAARSAAAAGMVVSAQLSADARRAVAGNVAQALAWVGDNRARAIAVLAWETAEGEGANRKTLVEPLQALAASEDASAAG